MAINIKKMKEKHPGQDLKIGEGFSETRGYIPEKPGIPKHNGLNVNNDPAHIREKESKHVKRSN